MAKVMTDDKHYKSIADKIRGHLNSEELMSPDVFAQKIDDVHSAGKQTAYDEFWDLYQQKGNIYAASYMFAFSGWNDTTFKPKYNMLKITNAGNMFNTCGVSNLRAILETQAVIFRFDNCTNFANMIAYSKITHFPSINTTKASALTNIFAYGSRLIEVGLVTLKEDGSQTFNNAFLNCTALENISFSGTIGQNFDIHWSPISKASIINIVEHLSSTTTGKTLTLSKAAVNTAFGIDVDDETTYLEGSEFYSLRHSRDNWTFNYI